MFVNDVISLQLRSQQLGLEGNPALNVFWYRCYQTDAPSDVLWSDDMGAAIVESWESMMLTPLKAITSNQWEYTSIFVTEETNPLKPFFLEPLAGGAGTVGQGITDGFVAHSYRLNRGNTLTRNGQKRFPGVPVGFYLNGSLVGTYAGVIAAVTPLLASSFTFEVDGYNFEMYPIIVRRPETGLVSVWQDVVSATFRGASTQNSRKD